MSAELQERCQQANKVIAIVARHGWRFFHSAIHERNARFGFDKHWQLWYLDEYTGMKIYPFEKGRWIGFTNGGTMRRSSGGDMRDFVARLAQYIMTGDQIEQYWFPIENDESRWAYGQDVMRALLAEVLAETKAVQGI